MRGNIQNGVNRRFHNTGLGREGRFADPQENQGNDSQAKVTEAKRWAVPQVGIAFWPRVMDQLYMLLT